MSQCFAHKSAVLTALGNSSDQLTSQIIAGNSAIKHHQNITLFSQPFYAALIENVEVLVGFSRFESMAIHALDGVLEKDKDYSKTLFLLSTTKGNISQIGADFLISEINLEHTAKKIAQHYGNFGKVMVVSHACISGVAAILIAQRWIKSGLFDEAIVCGVDELTPFVLNGFFALNAVSAEPCRPFDKDRNGINLGEAAAALVLSKETSEIEIIDGNVTNDANHISGPSRTGEELAMAVQKTMQDNAISVNDISFISAHGTATVYNDEMESKAFEQAGLSAVPLNSMKAYFGHTLGAAGVLESILTIESLKNGFIIPTKNYVENGVSGKINVCNELMKSVKKYAIKTASGFGGCNGVLLYSHSK